MRASFNDEFSSQRNLLHYTEHSIHTPPTVTQSEMGFEVRNLKIDPWDVINHRTIIRKSLGDSHASLQLGNNNLQGITISIYVYTLNSFCN